MFGFQSLSGLFQQPTTGRYSSSRKQEKPSSTPESPPIAQSQSTAEASPEPTFVPKATGPTLEVSPQDPAPTTPSQMQSRVSSQYTKDETVKPRPVRANRRRRLTHQPSSRNSHRPLNQGARSPRRRENPFKDASTLKSSHGDAAAESVKAPNSAHTTAVPSWGLSSDDLLSVDSMLDPGTTNVDFQAKKFHESPNATRSSKTSSLKRAVTPRQTASETRSSSAASQQGPSTKLTHVTSSGEAHMVNVGAKESTRRVAVAHAVVAFSNSEPFRLITENANKKGDVLGTARIAGIMASKRTSDLIPLCHPIAISKVELDVRLEPAGRQSYFNKSGVIIIHAVVECVGPTGVEMEALTAASAAALTVYDMCKAVDRDMNIRSQKVVYKSGGKSGTHFHYNWALNGGSDFLKKKGIEVDESLLRSQYKGLLSRQVRLQQDPVNGGEEL